MLRKQYTAGGKVKVTFSMPALEGVTALYLTGSFTDWSEPGVPLVCGPEGDWSVALTLEAGWAHQYRFRDQDGGWHNDWAADSYVPNEFGSENSVVDLTGGPAGPSPDPSFGPAPDPGAAAGAPPAKPRRSATKAPPAAKPARPKAKPGTAAAPKSKSPPRPKKKA